MEKIPIEGNFSKQDIEYHNTKFTESGRAKTTKSIDNYPKYMIRPHEGFELCELPDGSIVKLAYGTYYRNDIPDLEIELDQIANLEPRLENSNSSEVAAARKRLKYHYKKAISLVTPSKAAGWNRWSDNILELFLSEKIHKVLWGSGNCGKSAIMAVLLYIKWRVRPHDRMVVIASRVMQDATARVFGYIKGIHAEAPPSTEHRMTLVDNSRVKGIFCEIYIEKEQKWITDDRACIVSLPVKVNKKQLDIGSNLLGKHPNDRLILAFDECQELPATMAEDKIFVNWYTNKRLDVIGWGNPIPVQYHAPQEWDMLFKLGAGGLALNSLKLKEKEANKTSTWSWKDTKVLHLSMLDSPKDDPDEVNCFITRPDGTKEPRLHFLAGKDNVKVIASKISPTSASWYSQVLGFPYIDLTGSKEETVLNPFIIRKTKEYPLRWRTSDKELEWFMGVDPAVTGAGDSASIICARMGRMIDGRPGVDWMNGKVCTEVVARENEDFTDTIINTMYEISKEYRIRLKNIAIETHGVGEVLRYAIQGHIEDGKWAEDVQRGESYFIVNPTISPTERWLFKSLGAMQPAKEMVSDITTERYVAVRCGVLTRQFFNLPEEALKQFYNRYLFMDGGRVKYKLETKKQMRERNIASPNQADALCNVVEIIRQRGFSYVFHNSNKYQEVLGPQYDREQENKIIKQRLGAVSEIIGLGVNLGKYVDGKDEPTIKKEAIGACDIDVI